MSEPAFPDPSFSSTIPEGVGPYYDAFADGRTKPAEEVFDRLEAKYKLLSS